MISSFSNYEASPKTLLRARDVSPRHILRPPNSCHYLSRSKCPVLFLSIVVHLHWVGIRSLITGKFIASGTKLPSCLQIGRIAGLSKAQYLESDQIRKTYSQPFSPHRSHITDPKCWAHAVLELFANHVGELLWVVDLFCGFVLWLLYLFSRTFSRISLAVHRSSNARNTIIQNLEVSLSHTSQHFCDLRMLDLVVLKWFPTNLHITGSPRLLTCGASFCWLFRTKEGSSSAGGSRMRSLYLGLLVGLGWSRLSRATGLVYQSYETICQSLHGWRDGVGVSSR